MEKDDKGSTMIRMGVSGWMFLLVPAYPGCPGSKAVKRSLLLLLLPDFLSGFALVWVSSFGFDNCHRICIHRVCIRYNWYFNVVLLTTWYCCADISQRSSSSCQSSNKSALFRQFQQKADEAGLVVFVLSNDFAKSCFTRKQVIGLRKQWHSWECFPGSVERKSAIGVHGAKPGGGLGVKPPYADNFMIIMYRILTTR